VQNVAVLQAWLRNNGVQLPNDDGAAGDKAEPGGGALALSGDGPTGGTAGPGGGALALLGDGPASLELVAAPTAGALAVPEAGRREGWAGAGPGGPVGEALAGLAHAHAAQVELLRALGRFTRASAAQLVDTASSVLQLQARRDAAGLEAVGLAAPGDRATLQRAAMSASQATSARQLALVSELASHGAAFDTPGFVQLAGEAAERHADGALRRLEWEVGAAREESAAGLPQPQIAASGKSVEPDPGA